MIGQDESSEVGLFHPDRPPSMRVPRSRIDDAPSDEAAARFTR